MTQTFGPDRPHIAVVGMMGTGKSTVAALVAKTLDLPLVDTDYELELRLGETGREFAAREGVDKLHDLESEIVVVALESDVPAVITPAASAVDRPEVRELLKRRALVVWLRLDIADLEARMTAGAHRRPMSRSELEERMARRTPLFEGITHLTLLADQNPDELASAIFSLVLGDR